ncbi:expressed unknown protein [Seminavis robusta]|uniref:Uncharacterized protein n=1 Tax=Seminavis robusta TaxID=568900 RepID=A0A9N8EVY1_9STRA|nr:expressed unknown protein [Seminavis robusta]|eukprot:Sro1848_g301461.1  (167) ;mRNA; f:10928-11428
MCIPKHGAISPMQTFLADLLMDASMESSAVVSPVLVVDNARCGRTPAALMSDETRYHNDNDASGGSGCTGGHRRRRRNRWHCSSSCAFDSKSKPACPPSPPTRKPSRKAETRWEESPKKTTTGDQQGYQTNETDKTSPPTRPQRHVEERKRRVTENPCMVLPVASY